MPAAEARARVQEDTQAAEPATKGEPAKKGYVGIHSTGFKDFLLKPELMRAIVDCGFEHPSEGGVALATLHSRLPSQA